MWIPNPPTPCGLVEAYEQSAEIVIPEALKAFWRLCDGGCVNSDRSLLFFKDPEMSEEAIMPNTMMGFSHWPGDLVSEVMDGAGLIPFANQWPEILEQGWFQFGSDEFGNGIAVHLDRLELALIDNGWSEEYPTDGILPSGRYLDELMGEVILDGGDS
jgi:hypothetical protein